MASAVAPGTYTNGRGVERHQGEAARLRGAFADSSKIVKHISKMPPEPLLHTKNRMLDVDWRTIHNGEKEWLERGRHRDVSRMQREQNRRGIAVDGSNPEQKPWASLGDGSIGLGDGASRLGTGRSRASERLMSATGPTGFQQPPATASSRAISTASGPPRTASTTLSGLWRRALSTPALAGRAATGESKPLQFKMQVPGPPLPTEEWITNDLADGLDQDEIGRLIEHVHAKLLKERRRKQEAVAELAAIKAEKRAAA